MLKKVLFVLCFALILIVSLVLMFYKVLPPKTKIVDSANTTGGITSQVQWELGSYTNIRTVESPGNITIDDKGLASGAEIDLSTADITASNAAETGSNIYDKNFSTSWGPATIFQGSEWPNYLQLDFGQDISVRIIKINYTGGNIAGISYSADGSTFSQAHVFETMPLAGQLSEATLDSTIDARYWRVRLAAPSGGSMYVPELEFYEPGEATATHTSAATQITHNDLYQWQTFTPAYTAPANTTVSFRLRTSTDSSNWTDWTTYQTPNSAEALDISSLVTSSTGDAGSETFYKYIQVETKLTSSDGVSTPTVDSYSIGYHTNVPPNKPTGATVTVGD